MDSPHVLIDRVGRVGRITLNRPQTLNTLDVPMLLAMETALTELEGDDTVGAIVITGSDERSFIAGGNIGDLDSRHALDHYTDFALIVHRVFRRFETCDKPTLAAINGWALGGGTEFALAIDIRLIAEEAQMGLPEIRIGLFPGGGGSQRLMRQISPCQARLLMFTGDFINAAEAVRLGLVNEAVPRARLMERTMELATRIAGQSRWALRMLKRSMVAGAEMPLAAALEHEAATISLVFDSADAHEGMRAFLEKRTPGFNIGSGG